MKLEIFEEEVGHFQFEDRLLEDQRNAAYRIVLQGVHLDFLGSYALRISSLGFIVLKMDLSE